MVALGSAECRNLFLLEEDFTFINHGSFGCIPKSVFSAYTKLLSEVESNPDQWFLHKYRPLIKQSCEVLAPILNCNPEDLVFVENASTGVHTALRSIGLGPREGVLITNLSYAAIANTSRRFSEESNGKRHLLDLNPPISNREQVIEKYREYLKAHPDIKIAVIDHITSPSTMMLPVKEIVQVCREKGVVTVIDGAHAPGQLKIDLKEIDPDYYTGNLHKWFYCPRGCAILYIRPELQREAQPSLASNDHYLGYPHKFFYQGTRDYTPYCMVPKAVDFQVMLGGNEAIVSYCSSLCTWALNMLSEKWSEPKLPIPDNMRVPNMALVRLPSVLQGNDRQKIIDTMSREYKIIIAIDTVAGEVWVRISCNVYNTKRDYECLSEAILDLTKNLDKLNL